MTARDTTTTRRAFLGASAMLAAGAVIQPAAAIGRTAPDADLRARITAILATPRTRRAGCDCRACRVVKARSFLCVGCGYRGQPTTLPCDCRVYVEHQIGWYDSLLRDHPTAADWRKLGWKLTRSQATRDRRALARIHPLIEPCQGHGQGQPEQAGRLFDFSGSCVHTTPVCPICDDTEHDEAAGLLAVLRDLHVALTL